MYFITFRAESTAHNLLMPIEALSKQEAVDKAREFYGESVSGVISQNEADNTFKVIPFGSLVYWDELNTKRGTVRHVYPKFGTTLIDLTDPIKSITKWFNTANPEPDNASVAVQIGVHIEEFREMLSALEEVNPTIIAPVKQHLLSVENLFKNLGSEFKFHSMNQDKKVELLDSLADQTVTATGIAYRMKFKFHGALQEVSKSNWSKFENGKPIRDENGKIIKGKDYFKPDLTKFV